MEEYTFFLKEYVGTDRKTYNKTMFKIMGTIYRGVNKNRFTLADGLNALEKMTKYRRNTKK